MSEGKAQVSESGHGSAGERQIADEGLDTHRERPNVAGLAGATKALDTVEVVSPVSTDGANGWLI